MDLNVDVIDNETGEIYREGVLLANAHIFIARENGKIVRDDIDVFDIDDIDGGGQMEVRSIYVDFPEEKLKRELSAGAIVRLYGLPRGRHVVQRHLRAVVADTPAQPPNHAYALTRRT